MNDQLKKYAIISVIVLLLTWSIGPYIAIAGVEPLSHWSIKIIITAIIVFGWLGYVTWQWQKKRPKKKWEKQQQQPPWIHRFKQILQATQKHYRDNQRSWLWKPAAQWTLVIELKQQSSNQLMTHLQCQPIQLADEANIPVPFNGWYNDHECFLVTDHERLAQQQKQYLIWRPILSILKRKRLIHPIKRILIIINAPSLCNNDANDLITINKNLTIHLERIHQLSTKIPIQLVIDDCDHLIGFNEYFAMNKPYAKQPTFGINLQQKNTQGFDDTYHEQRQSLLEKITTNIFTLMQKQHQDKPRNAIAQFPMQLDFLFLRIKKILNPFPDAIKQHITHINLCAYEQHPQSASTLTPYLKEIITPLSDHMAHIEPTHKALFIGTKKFGSCESMSTLDSKNQAPAVKITLTALFSILIGATIISFYYTQVTHSIDQSNTTLAALNDIKKHSSKLPVPSQMTWLNELNDDQQLLGTLKQSGTLKYRWLGSNASYSLYQKITSRYKQALNTEFEPYALSLLTAQLTPSTSSDAIGLYNALKIYLMLTENQHIDKQAITNWYNQQWNNSQYDKTVIDKLNEQLNFYLKHRTTAWPSNPGLVESARNQLSQLPLNVIVLLKIWTEQGQKTSPITKDTYEFIEPNSLQISDIFTQESYDKITHLSQGQLLDILNTPNWVLANATPTPSLDQQVSLAKNVTALYQKEFNQAWDLLLDKLEFKKPKSIHQLTDIIDQVIDKNSSYYQLIKDITKNTSSPTQATVQNFFNQANSNNDWINSLKALQTSLEQLAQSQDSNEAVYLYTKTQFANTKNNPDIISLGKQLSSTPVFMQNCLNNISNNYWPTLLKQAQAYLNTQWKSKVVSEYTNTIIHRFPIFQTATSDITIDDFNQFFGPKGTIDNFFNQYLAAFVDTSGHYWTWKKIDNHAINIPQSTLDMIIRASIIQQMFYRHGTTSPYEEFALTPKQLSNHVTSATFDIEGLQLTFTPDDKTIQKVSVPGDDPGKSTLTLTNGANETVTVTGNGVWSWLRLVDQASLNSTSDANQFLLSFTLHNETADFGLVTENNTTPYLPNVLTAFRCPDKL